VTVRVFTAGAAEAQRRIAGEPMLVQLKTAMLTRQDDRRSKSAGRERIGDR
jgi:hypothetical protein